MCGRSFTRQGCDEASGGFNKPRCDTLFYLPIPTVPEPLSVPETVYSYQGYETTEKTDSDSSLPSSSSHHTEDVAGIEYEPVAAEEEDNIIRNSNSSDSDIESRKEWYPKHSKKKKKEKTFRIQPSRSCRVIFPRQLRRTVLTGRNRTSRMTICPFPSSNGRDLNHPLLDRLVGLQRRFIHTKYLRRLHGRGKPLKWKDLPKEVPLPGTFKNICWMTLAPFAITDLKMPP